METEKIEEEVIKMNMILEHVQITGFGKCHTNSNENRRRRRWHEEIKCKEEKRIFLEKKDPERYQ